MSLTTDQTHLLESQYQDASNLNARIALHARFSLNSYGWHRWVFDHFDLPPESHLLELGCGPGTLWLKNQERFPPGWKVMLSDFSAGMIAEARQNLAEVKPAFHFQVFDAQSLPLPDASLDAVIANHMLYHVPDRRKAFAEIRRVLKPEGRLYAATNGQDHLRELDALQDRFGLGKMIASTNVFSLNNGGDQLADWFAYSCLHLYEDGLCVTEAEPLVSFILSMSSTHTVSEEQRAALTAFVRNEIAQQGAIHITKSTGLFIASQIPIETEVRQDETG